MLQRVKVWRCTRPPLTRKEAMDPALPRALRAEIDALLEGVSRKELGAKAATISQAYRTGGNSVQTITDDASALAYVLTRMPATYAVASVVFDAIKEAAPEFAPQSLLDIGAGPGTASWAASEAWPDLRNVTMADSHAPFLRLAERLAERHRILARADFVAGDLRDAAFSLPKAELVAASFVLAEIDEQEDIIARLWTAATDTLVLVEPGTPAGFARIRAARQWLIDEGGYVLAPCTHDANCPIAGSDWCHFSQRLPRSRDHLKLKDASVPFEDERYSYVVVRRVPVVRGSLARIIAPTEETKAGLTLPLCTDRGLHRAFVSRRQREVFAPLRKAKWGDTILSED